MKRYGIAATAGVAALVLGTSAALADNAIKMGSALKWDRTELTLDQLSRMLPAPTNTAPAIQVGNQFPEAALRGTENDLAADPVISPVNPVLSPTSVASFDTYSSDDNAALFGFRIQPPDTNGDVGLNDVVTYVNLGWSVYDKGTGALTAGPFAGNSFWAGFGGACESQNDGDPIVIYDEDVGRWVFNQFAPRSGIQCFAISDGESPLGPYTRYAFLVEPNAFNDYPKVGVWTNENGSQSAYTYTGRNFTPQGNPAFARDITAVLFDRDAMLAGGPANFITTVMPGGFVTYDGAQPGSVQALSDAPGDACPLFSVAQAPSTYRFFEYCEAFPNGNGSFREVQSVTVPNFDDNLGDVPQPGGDNLDTLAFFTMYRSNHANINGQHQLAMSHTVDAGGDRGGMRWAILDVDDYDNISLIDTGTQAPNDGFERWMGSVALDTLGNLGMGYTRGGNNQPTDVYVTGRETTDAAGTLQQEVECVDGQGVQTGGGGRWGDYSATVLDPSDGCTFWTFQEYVQTTGSFQWNTRACAFNFPSCTGIEPPTEFTLLATDPGVAGQVNDFNTINGTPSRGVIVYFGRQAGSTPLTVGQCSTTIDLASARALGFDQANGSGEATVSFNIPGAVANRTFLFQALDLFECETSNVVTTTF
jgi:hypothetical protein